jgi:hypothetical protein
MPTKKKIEDVQGKVNVFIFRVLCSTIYYLLRVLWAPTAQLMSLQAKSLKELTMSTYIVYPTYLGQR